MESNALSLSLSLLFLLLFLLLMILVSLCVWSVVGEVGTTIFVFTCLHCAVRAYTRSTSFSLAINSSRASILSSRQHQSNSPAPRASSKSNETLPLEVLVGLSIVYISLVVLKLLVISSVPLRAIRLGCHLPSPRYQFLFHHRFEERLRVLN